jgi:hypothetical protein
MHLTNVALEFMSNSNYYYYYYYYYYENSGKFFSRHKHLHKLNFARFVVLMPGTMTTAVFGMRRHAEFGGGGGGWPPEAIYNLRFILKIML